MLRLSKYDKFVSDYDVLLAIGNTPTIKLDFPFDIGDTEIFAKCEQLNPGGSIKDRPVLRMLVDAVLSGQLTKDKVILDATSGNAGVSYAMIGAALGYAVELVIPMNASKERKQRIKSHGANIIFTDPMLGYDETLREVKRIYDRDQDKYFWCDQYGNPNNPQAHYDSTGNEIIRQVPDVTHFVAGVGTGGTISGVGKRLKEHNHKIKIVCINFDEWPGVEGLKPLGQGHIVPDTFDESIVDQMVKVGVDDGRRMSKLLASKGLFAGQSSGAYLEGAYKVAKEAKKGRVVTIINDIGERYFSTGLWAVTTR